MRVPADHYIRLVVSLSKKTLGGNLVSIVLFGSYARNEASKVSDVDLLIVVRMYDDSAQRLEKLLRKVSISYGITFEPKGMFGKLLYALSQATGMFRPAFVAEEKDILAWRFHRVFRVSRFMSRLLAPSESVKFTIGKSYRVLYGKDVLRMIKTSKPTLGEIIRSLLMNMLLAFCSFVLVPLHRETYRFVYEAVKWSLFNYAYVSRRPPRILELSRLFMEPVRRGMEHFLNTRNNGRLSPGLLLYALPAILKIHIASIRALMARRRTKSS